MVQGVNEVHEHCSGPDRLGGGKGVFGGFVVQGTAPLENFGKHLKIRVPPFYPSYLLHCPSSRDYVPLFPDVNVLPQSTPQEGP